MNEYRQAHSVAFYDAGVTITNATRSATRSNSADNQGYPLATGIPPGSFTVPESDLSSLKSEFRTGKQFSLPTGRRQGGGLSFHKTLSSYNETLGEDARVKNLLIRIDGPQLLSIQIVEERQSAEGKHSETKEITYCGFFAIEWATSEL
ncbi:MAG: hypothetical protein Q3M30_20330 [Candidatus Electrothrix sp. Rat3]|nr:hypothetical protein [Candidatus Electrothrix rattekaaiensis]